MDKLEQLRAAYQAACERVTSAGEAIDALDERDDATVEEYDAANTAMLEATSAADKAKADLEQRESVERARAQHKPEPAKPSDRPVIEVDEPDMYVKGGRSFMVDLYRAQLKGDFAAQKRVQDHHEYMLREKYPDVEKRAVATGTLGGLIPPAYLIDLYAKAGRNGRVYANQANHQVLPDVGMSVIVPRLTVGLAAGVQTAESATVTTQDPTEVDLTVPVRTIAGYSPVSRQTLERAAYSDTILMEDLTARYNALLDTQCITGTGASGQILGVLNTAGISTSAVSTATAVAIWPKFADVIQQISTAFGGLGINADRIIMHPRRWGSFAAAVDTQGRPLYQPASMGNVDVSTFAEGGGTSVYGFTGAMIQGLPVFTDANIPTNLGAGTNQDVIIVQASDVVHLWERDADPVTLAFEQQAGTALQVQLVAYGYAAFTAGRYPAASGTITGTGLVPPTF